MLGDLGQAAGTPGKGDQSNRQADAAAAQPWMLSCTWSPMIGKSATAEPRKALLEAGFAAEQEPEHRDHDQQQGKEREERL